MIRLSLLLEMTPSEEAKSKGLTHVGWGKYADKSGKVVATSDGDKLTFLSPTSAPIKKKMRPSHRTPISVKGKTVVVTSVPTTKDPSFEQLKVAAKPVENSILSRNPLKKLNFDRVRQGTRPDKPNGLWFGKGSSWIDWLESEMPRWKGDYLYSMKVDQSKILTIKDDGDMYDFIRKYGRTAEGWELRSETEWRNSNIDWKSVATDWMGIDIQKYFWDLRLELAWYYSWDVASGCIWNSDAIVSIEQVPVH